MHPYILGDDWAPSTGQSPPWGNCTISTDHSASLSNSVWKNLCISHVVVQLEYFLCGFCMCTLRLFFICCGLFILQRADDSVTSVATQPGWPERITKWDVQSLLNQTCYLKRNLYFMPQYCLSQAHIIAIVLVCHWWWWPREGASGCHIRLMALSIRTLEVK